MTFVKKEDGTETEIGTVINNTMLTVSKYNGAFIKLTINDPTKATDDLLAAYSSDSLKVNKHQMRVVADDVTLTYGDNAPSEYTFHYTMADLVNGDTLSSERFNEGLSEPTVSCDNVIGQSVCG